MNRIGGVLDVKALDALLGRDRYRPKTRAEMRAAVQELAARGWTDHTIATSVGLDVEMVRRMLGEMRE